jgi:RNA polymerase sigma-70 factor (ECF subfamily)
MAASGPGGQERGDPPPRSPFSLVTPDTGEPVEASPRGDDERFRALFEDRYQAIHRYVRRRIGTSGDDVLDVTAQVFTVAWRRFDRIPEPPLDLPWLYGVARKIVSRQQRTLRRRQGLKDRLTAEAAVSSPDPPTAEPDSARVLRAIERLRPKDREVVRLVLWEQLSHADAALVLGCSPNAIAIRMHRVRERLRIELTTDPTRPSDPSRPERPSPEEP